MEDLRITTTNGTTGTYLTSEGWWSPNFWDTDTVYIPSIWTTSPDYYKITNNNEGLTIKILAAGVEKDDIKAYIEDTTLYVRSEKSEYENINFNLNLAFYNIVTKKASLELKNGVLIVKFPKKERKQSLEIK